MEFDELHRQKKGVYYFFYSTILSMHLCHLKYNKLHIFISHADCETEKIQKQI